jgi:type III secretory pathway component EscV
LSEGLSEVRLAFSPDGRHWDDETLWSELNQSGEGGCWSLWRWLPSTQPRALLEITLYGPEHSAHPAELLEKVRAQLEHSFTLYSAERGWPRLAYQVRWEATPGGEWSYRISMPGGPSAEGQLQPTKLLVMGEPQQMSHLLGLETSDPMLGLPAKWIARSQLELARSIEGHVFDSPSLVAAHTLHLVGPLWHRCFGFEEVQRWLLACLPGQSELLAEIFPQNGGLLVRTLKDLIAEQLRLPSAPRYLELFLETLPELPPEKNFPLCAELMRKEVLRLNLDRFSDAQGVVHAIDWRGQPEDDHHAQLRMLHRLDAALQEYPQTTALLTAFELRRTVAQVLRNSHPWLPVLSWDELPGQCYVQWVAVIDTRFEADPSPWAGATFLVEPREEHPLLS